MKFKIFTILFIITFGCSNSLAQNNREIDSLKAISFGLNNDIEMINISLKISDLLLYSSSEEALEFANKAFSIAKEHSAISGEANSLYRIGNIFLRQLKFKMALDFAHRSFEIAELNDLPEEKIEALLVKGYVFNNLGDFDKSSKLFFNCLKFSEEIHDKQLISKSLTGIGYSYFQQQNFDKAIEFYLRALKNARGINYVIGISINLNNIAAVYGRTNKPDKLKVYLLESIKINKSLGNNRHLATNYSNMAAYHFGNEQPDSSFYYLDKALHLAVNSNNTALVSHIKFSIGNQLFENGHYTESLKNVFVALKFAQQHGLKKNIYSSALLLDSIYKKMHDYEQAYHYQAIASELKDSLDLGDRITELSKLELLYDLEKKEREKETNQQLRELGYLLGGIILILALGFALLLLKRSKMKSKISSLEKQKLEKELEVKNKELTNNVISLMKKNELLSEFSSQLLEIEKKAVKDETKSNIHKISKRLKQSIESEIWEEFKVRFNEVHIAFYQKLMNKYPNLTPNEQRLSAFLRLNMTTKEISELTGQSISAIEMGRFRLRKKLQITGTDKNLITFLSKI